MSTEQQLKCLNCFGPVTPNDENCPYCGYYNGAYAHAKRRPDLYPQPEPKVEESSSSSGHTSSSGGGALRGVIYFAILLLVVTIMGSVFTNGSIQSDFTSAAVMSSSLLAMILILGAVRMVAL